MSRFRYPLLDALVLVSAAYLVLGTRPEAPAPIRFVPGAAVHGVGYAVLSTLTAATAVAWSVTAAPVVAVVYATVHGAVLEGVQSVMPPRTADWRDLLVDLAGALIGALPWWRRR